MPYNVTMSKRKTKLKYRGSLLSELKLDGLIKEDDFLSYSGVCRYAGKYRFGAYLLKTGDETYLDCILDKKKKKECIRNANKKMGKVVHYIKKNRIRILNNYLCDSKIVPIEDLPLSVRAYNCLKRAGYKTSEDIIIAGKEKVRHTRNLGEKSFKEVIRVIEEKTDVSMI